MENSVDNLHAHMNHTKWEELRVAMYDLGDNHPKRRTKDIETGYLSTWDGERHYYFRDGAYSTIEYVEIQVSGSEMRELVRHALVQIHVPGRETKDGFIVLGYTRGEGAVDYIKSL